MLARCKWRNTCVNPDIFDEILQVWRRQTSNIFVRLHNEIIRFPGKCGNDGFYYKDHGSFVICSNGNAYDQHCAPGSRNSGVEHYSHGNHYYYRDFCDVNLVDYGYGAAHGSYGSAGYGNVYGNGYASGNSYAHGNRYSRGNEYNRGYGRADNYNNHYERQAYH